MEDVCISDRQNNNVSIDLQMHSQLRGIDVFLMKPVILPEIQHEDRKVLVYGHADNASTCIDGSGAPFICVNNSEAQIGLKEFRLQFVRDRKQRQLE